MEGELRTPPRPLRGAARVVIILLALGALVNGVSLVVEAVHVGILQQLDRGVNVDIDKVSASDARVGASAFAQIVVYVLTIAGFLFWFHRAYANLPRLGARWLRFGRGWAIGAWFVPFLNLWRPKQIANDIWRASDPDAPAYLDAGWPKTRVPALLHWWWAMWLVSSFLDRGASDADADASTLPDQIDAAYALIVADALGIVAAALAATVVWRISGRQDERARRLGERGDLG